jgi:hypothetical protein
MHDEYPDLRLAQALTIVLRVDDLRDEVVARAAPSVIGKCVDVLRELRMGAVQAVARFAL